MIDLKERIYFSKAKYIKLIIAIFAAVIIIAVLISTLIDSYGVTGYATGSETYNRYVDIKYTYTQNKETNKVAVNINYFRLYSTKDGAAFSCSAPLELRYGLYGGTDTQYRKYAATKNYEGQKAGYKGLITLAGWDLKSATVSQPNGKPVTLTIYGKCDLTGGSKGNHTVTKKIPVPGYNGGEKITAGTVTWIDDNNRDGKRPDSISFKVMRNPSSTEDGAAPSTSTKTISSGSWSHTGFAYGYGATYSFSVSYPDVKDYTKVVSGNDVTYTYAPEEVTPLVDIIWNDNNDENKIRPMSIALNFIRNNEIAGTANAETQNNWRLAFSSVHRYEAGKVCSFDIKAPDIDGYTKSIKGDIDTGYTVIYTYVPGQGVSFGFSV